VSRSGHGPRRGSGLQSDSRSNGGACVEIGTADPAVAVHDSKHPDGPLLAFTADIWRAFTEQVKADA
jgi:hypothetical protein